MRAKRKIWGMMAGILIGILVIGAPAMAQGETPAETGKSGSDYLIWAGDLLEIVVWKNDDLSGEFRVRPDGKFSMPLIGDVVAQGKTTGEINNQIQTKLELFIESPFVSTIIRETASNLVYVLGEVTTPGAYPIQGSMTVLQALALAGGFTEFAIRDRMVLVRGSGETQQNFALSYRKILAEPGGEFNMVLERGDTLVVP
jgi:polysaccharide export outer membrane protein